MGIVHELVAEHTRLSEHTQALRREHEVLQSRRVDMEEHALHRAKLHAHLEALHEHVLRWRDRSRI